MKNTVHTGPLTADEIAAAAAEEEATTGPAVEEDDQAEDVAPVKKTSRKKG